MDDNRAEKSGIALEAQQKIHSKYDSQLAHQLLSWIQVGHFFHLFRFYSFSLSNCGHFPSKKREMFTFNPPIASDVD